MLKREDLYIPGRLVTSWPLIKSSTSSGFKWYWPSGFAFLVAILARRILEPVVKDKTKSCSIIHQLFFKFLNKYIYLYRKVTDQFLKTMKIINLQFWSFQLQYKSGWILLGVTDYKAAWLLDRGNSLLQNKRHFNAATQVK